MKLSYRRARRLGSRVNGRRMDAQNSGTADGVQLWHYDCNGTNAQRFHLTWRQGRVGNTGSRCE